MSKDIPESLTFEESGPTLVPVTIRGDKYELREANGDAACQYRNAMIERTKVGPDGKPTTLIGIAELEPFLVSLCLYHVGGPHNGNRVAIEHVKTFNHSTVEKLATVAKEISQLDLDEQTDASLSKAVEEAQARLDRFREEQAKLKNSSASTGSGSK